MLRLIKDLKYFGKYIGISGMSYQMISRLQSDISRLILEDKKEPKLKWKYLKAHLPGKSPALKGYLLKVK